MNPFVKNHPVYRQTFGLPPLQSAFEVPPVEQLIQHAAETGAGAHFNFNFSEMSKPSREPATLAEAKTKILGLTNPGPGMTPEDVDFHLKACDFFSELEARLAARRTRESGELQSRYERVYQQCRELKDRTRELRYSIGATNTSLMSIDERAQQAKSAVDSIQTHKPARSEYPSQQELDAWRQELEQAQATLNTIEAEQARERALLDGLEEQLRDAERSLRGLEQTEDDLHKQIAGEERRRGGLLIRELEL